MGGCWEDANVAIVGNVIVGMDYSAVMGGGGTLPSRGDGVRQGHATPHRHAVSPVYTHHVYTHRTHNARATHTPRP